MQIVDVGFFACFSVVCIQEGPSTKSLGFICTVGVTGRAVCMWRKEKPPRYLNLEVESRALKQRLHLFPKVQVGIFSHSKSYGRLSRPPPWTAYDTSVTFHRMPEPYSFRHCACRSIWLVKIVNKKFRLVWAKLKCLCCLNWQTSCFFTERMFRRIAGLSKHPEMVMPEGPDCTACCYLEADTDK